MSKIIREDGHITYYYYKKKRGRPKKRGPKKKKKLRGRRWQETWDYKIIRFNFRKQDEYIGKYRTLDEVEKAKEILSSENDKIVFPKKFTNNSHNSNKLYEYLSEYVILKRKKSEEESNVTQLRNEYGKFVDNTITSDNWIIYDKMPCLKEETFWVYGFNPKTDRKDFNWIYDNLIKDKVENNYELLWIYCYNNKLIIRGDSDFDFVICKNISDAIRMYNLIDERKGKSKQIIMTGFVKKDAFRAHEIIDLIKQKTGWELNKIYRTTT